MPGERRGLANKRPPWALLKTRQIMLKTSHSMLKTLHLTQSRTFLARFHQSVDCSTCCGNPIALSRRIAASAARAMAHHCWGVAAPPCDAITSCTSRTTATGFVLRHALQQRWAGRQLPPWYGDPPWDTGSASSTTPWHGSRLGIDGSIGKPQIQHGLPCPRTLALTMRRRWPLAYRGLTVPPMQRPPQIWQSGQEAAAPPDRSSSTIAYSHAFMRNATHGCALPRNFSATPRRCRARRQRD